MDKQKLTQQILMAMEYEGYDRDSLIEIFDTNEETMDRILNGEYTEDELILFKIINKFNLNGFVMNDGRNKVENFNTTLLHALRINSEDVEMVYDKEGYISCMKYTEDAKDDNEINQININNINYTSENISNLEIAYLSNTLEVVVKARLNMNNPLTTYSTIAYTQIEYRAKDYNLIQNIYNEKEKPCIILTKGKYCIETYSNNKPMPANNMLNYGLPRLNSRGSVYEPKLITMLAGVYCDKIVIKENGEIKHTLDLSQNSDILDILIKLLEK